MSRSARTAPPLRPPCGIGSAVARNQRPEGVPTSAAARAVALHDFRASPPPGRSVQQRDRRAYQASGALRKRAVARLTLTRPRCRPASGRPSVSGAARSISPAAWQVAVSLDLRSSWCSHGGGSKAKPSAPEGPGAGGAGRRPPRGQRGDRLGHASPPPGRPLLGTAERDQDRADPGRPEGPLAGPSRQFPADVLVARQGGHGR
jgi:hypothetical protein